MGTVLAVGERVPDATVWVAPREPLNLRDFEGPFLLVAYYFDWSKSQ